jgi:hypothetical protein
MERSYDYILVGTDMATSLLSLHLSQRSSVLHLSGEAQYGGDHSGSSVADLLDLLPGPAPDPEAPPAPPGAPRPSYAGTPGFQLLHHRRPPEFPYLHAAVATPYGPGKITSLGTDTGTDSCTSTCTSTCTVSLPYGTLHCPASSLSPSTAPPPPHHPRFPFPGFTQHLLFAGQSASSPEHPSVVETLVSSGVADYLDFMCTASHRVHHGGAVHPVPVSKSSLFSSKLLRPLEKRKLTKVSRASEARRRRCSCPMRALASAADGAAAALPVPPRAITGAAKRVSWARARERGGWGCGWFTCPAGGWLGGGAAPVLCARSRAR